MKAGGGADFRESCHRVQAAQETYTRRKRGRSSEEAKIGKAESGKSCIYRQCSGGERRAIFEAATSAVGRPSVGLSKLCVESESTWAGSV